jgi:hypothetical protein
MSDSTIARPQRLAASPAAPTGVLQRGLVFGLSYGFVLSTYVHLGFVYFLFWLWVLVPLVVKSPAAQRIAVVLVAAYGCMMFGVSAWQQDLPEPRSWPHPHPAFGEHPVTVLAGFPWAGVEGCRPHPLAQGRVPLFMGVDAMLVNLTAFASVLWLLLRRVRAEELPGLLIAASAFAALMGMVGAWHLAYMFD